MIYGQNSVILPHYDVSDKFLLCLVSFSTAQPAKDSLQYQTILWRFMQVHKNHNWTHRQFQICSLHWAMLCFLGQANVPEHFPLIIKMTHVQTKFQPHVNVCKGHSECNFFHLSAAPIWRVRHSCKRCSTFRKTQSPPTCAIVANHQEPSNGLKHKSF